MQFFLNERKEIAITAEAKISVFGTQTIILMTEDLRG